MFTSDQTEKGFLRLFLLKLFQSLKANLLNERGAALLLTMILMVVLSLLTVSLYEMLHASTQITGNHRQDLQAIYVADAGVEDAIDQLRADPDDVTNFSGVLPTIGGTYNVTIADATDDETNPVFNREIEITSTGTFHSVTRTLKVHVGLFRIRIEEPDGLDSYIYPAATISWKLM